MTRLRDEMTGLARAGRVWVWLRSAQQAVGLGLTLLTLYLMWRLILATQAMVVF